MPTTVADLCHWLDALAPPHLAASWDNTGLILGDASAPVVRVITCLTVTPDVVAEAVQQGVQLIVSHHPVLFKATKNLSSHSADGQLLLPLLRHGIAVYSPHTSFDNCPGGINDSLAVRLGLQNVQPLRWHDDPPLYKLVVYTPDEAVEQVLAALFEAGAGHIGNYKECSFRSAGTGTFFPLDNANPAIGSRGQREQVAEQRIEVILPAAKQWQVLQAMQQAHPYEEVAYDLLGLVPKQSYGEARMGQLPKMVVLEEVLERVATVCGVQHLQHVGDLAVPVQRVAVACGAAGEFIKDAIRAKADVLVVGEVRFHEALLSRTSGLCLAIPGHYGSERPAVQNLATRLAAAFPTLQCFASQVESDPLSWAQFAKP